MNWPTTKGLSPRLDPESVREYLNRSLPSVWGARVDERMKALGMNNAQLAVLTGTTPQTVSKLRNGEIIPRDYLRLLVAIALGSTTEQLFPMPRNADVEAAVLKAAS